MFIYQLNIDDKYHIISLFKDLCCRIDRFCKVKEANSIIQIFLLIFFEKRSAGGFLFYAVLSCYDKRRSRFCKVVFLYHIIYMK